MNAHVFVRESGAWVGATQEGDLEWQIEPAVGIDVEFREFGGEGTRGVEVWGSQPFPENSSVVLWNYATDSDVTTFVTGSGSDTTPPSWTSQYSASVTKQDFAGDGCERTAVTFTIEGAVDSGGFPPLILLEPLADGGDVVFGVAESGETLIGASYTEACGGDENILTSKGRNYRLTLLDVAGNALDGGVLRGCACSTAEGTGRWPGALALACAALFARRRRPRH